MRVTLAQYWLNAGPASETLGRHWARTGSAHRVNRTTNLIILWQCMPGTRWRSTPENLSQKPPRRGSKPLPKATAPSRLLLTRTMTQWYGTMIKWIFNRISRHCKHHDALCTIIPCGMVLLSYTPFGIKWVNIALRRFLHNYGNTATEGSPKPGLCSTLILEWFQAFFIGTIGITVKSMPLNSLEHCICLTTVVKDKGAGL